jgi:enoyl-CoA hydratase/carnithine racemase
MNALTVPMGHALAKVLSSIDTEATSVVVVTGTGKVFSAGGDFDFLKARAADTGSRNAALMRQFYDMYLGAIRRFPLPTIAAINGPAVGAGLMFSAAMDLRIAAHSARMGVTFTAIGLHPGMGSTHILPALIGPQLAAKMCLTGELINGTTAAEYGLVAESVDDAEVLPRAMELAAQIAANAPVAVRSCARSLRMQVDDGLDRALWREADAQSYCYSGPDLFEGVNAVAGKRKPVFTQVEKYNF